MRICIHALPHKQLTAQPNHLSPATTPTDRPLPCATPKSGGGRDPKRQESFIERMALSLSLSLLKTYIPPLLWVMEKGTTVCVLCNVGVFTLAFLFVTLIHGSWFVLILTK